eukprot:scaffold3771_cov43-Prasinocladus_malaysianus.AAC.2
MTYSLIGTAERPNSQLGGAIWLDGVDVQQIPVRRLRRVCGVLAQDPFFFRGSVRQNVDPQGRYKDSQIKQMLEVATPSPHRTAEHA